MGVTKLPQDVEYNALIVEVDCEKVIPPKEKLPRLPKMKEVLISIFIFDIFHLLIHMIPVEE